MAAKEPEMEITRLDSAMEQLSRLLIHSKLTLAMKQQVEVLQLELRFLKLVFSSLSKFKDADETTPARFGSLKMDMESELAAAGQGIYEAGFFAIIGIDVNYWECLTSNLVEKIGLLKPRIRKLCVDRLDGSFLCSSSMNADGILEFIDPILMNLEYLVRLKDDQLIHVEKQIHLLEEKLRFSRNIVDFTAKYCVISHGKLEDLLTKVQSWANDAACMALLYWVNGMDEKMAPRMEIMLRDITRKIIPSTPEVAEMYLELMRSSKSTRSDSSLTGEIVVSFVDFLLENLTTALKDYIESLREGLIFGLSFLLDSPEEIEDRLSIHIDLLFNALKSLICSVSTKVSISKDENVPLLDFLQKINNAREEVRESYVHLPSSAESGFPKLMGAGFFDTLLDDLEMIKCQGKFIRFAKHKVGIIREELMPWRTFVKDIMRQQNEHDEEHNDLLKRIMNVAYQTEHAISSCLSTDCRIWFDLTRLASVLKEIKLISYKMAKKAKEKQIQNTGQPSSQMNSPQVQPLDAKTLKADDIVGFKDEADAIVHQLKSRSGRLHIVSVVGMAGVGKTTLARKVYIDRSVQLHFTKHAWCFVPQAFRSRHLLLEILKSVTAMNDAQISKMTDEDLAEKLRKSLKGERYLIVLDNIWDIRAWEAVKDGLPDDEKGSRILFTSQNHNLALETKLSCENKPLTSLSDTKSWDFLQEKLFGQDACPEELVNTGKQIARSCKGLPLAIVVIAALLSREKTSLNWWKQIEENLVSRPDAEGYMNILEISYKHLPDYLKPCFLYLGAFGEGEVMTARKLAILWIAEGFVERNEMMSSEAMAKSYLIELINRSLVIVTERSSNGGVKSCRVHDLLHKLCTEKSKEEMFLLTLPMPDASPQLDPVEYNHYRLSLHKEWETLVGSFPTSSHARTFLLLANSTRWNQSYSDSSTSHLFRSFKLLKVLDMESIYLGYSFPKEIVFIVQLRYLAIRGSFMSVPAAVSNLRNLETLIVSSSGPHVSLPNTIWRMKSLKYVEVNPRAFIYSCDVELEEIPYLNSIEAFSCLSLYHGEDTEKLIRRLSRLHKLTCVFLESRGHVWKGIQFPSLEPMEGLESLKLSVHASDRQVFLSWMRIQFHGFNFPSTLKKLTLYKFGLPWRRMSNIGKLKNLEVLKLRDDAFRGKTWDMEDEQFQNLKSFELSKLNIEHWNVSADSFTSLERLGIGDCDGLEKIPTEFGDLSTMKIIELRRFSEVVRSSAEDILETQRSWSNDEFEVIFH